MKYFKTMMACGCALVNAIGAENAVSTIRSTVKRARQQLKATARFFAGRMAEGIVLIDSITTTCSAVTFFLVTHSKFQINQAVHTHS